MNLTANKRIIYKAASAVTIRVEFRGEGELNCMSSTTVIDNPVPLSDHRVHEIPLAINESIFAWGSPSISYKLFLNGNEVQFAPVNDTSLDAVKQSAQSAVGLAITALTSVQQRSLLACLLYKAGGIDETGKVKPLNLWIKQ